MLPLWRNRTLGEGLPQEGQDRAGGGRRTGRAAYVSGQSAEEVRPHEPIDVAVGVEIKFQAARAVDVVDVQHRSHSERNPNRDYYKCPVCNCFKWVDEWSGKSSAEEWGRDDEVKKPLSDANCFKCGAAGHWARDCPTNSKPEADKPAEEEDFPQRDCEKGCGPLSIRTARSEQNSGRKYYKSARGVLLYLRLAHVAAMASRLRELVRRRRDSNPAGATRATSSSGATRCRPREAVLRRRDRPVRPDPRRAAAARTRASSAARRGIGPAIVRTRARASAAPTGAVPVATAAARARRRAAVVAAATASSAARAGTGRGTVPTLGEAAATARATRRTNNLAFTTLELGPRF